MQWLKIASSSRTLYATNFLLVEGRLLNCGDTTKYPVGLRPILTKHFNCFLVFVVACSDCGIGMKKNRSVTRSSSLLLQVSKWILFSSCSDHKAKKNWSRTKIDEKRRWAPEQSNPKCFQVWLLSLFEVLLRFFKTIFSGSWFLLNHTPSFIKKIFHSSNPCIVSRNA